jgi:hypothetical protein
MNLFGHEQYPSSSMDQKNSAHGVIMYPNEGVTFLLGFVTATQYLSKFQKIWYGAQTISRLPRMAYYMFIEYFVLWTWVKHT